MAAILRLDTRDDGIAAALWQLFQDAYAIEAALLDVTDFPPLRRTVADIQGSHTEFHGILAGGELAAVAELAREPDFCIDALVVAPTQFRRGLASHSGEPLVGTPFGADGTTATCRGYRRQQ